jgi:putative FmdB family regulatory protein
MPIYEYGCDSCGHVEEVFQKISDDPLTECPKCNGKVKKLMSMNTFHLKGSGWYVTDYASKGGSSSASTNSSPQSSESKTETKSKDTSSGKATKSSESSGKSTKD